MPVLQLQKVKYTEQNIPLTQDPGVTFSQKYFAGKKYLTGSSLWAFLGVVMCVVAPWF